MRKSARRQLVLMAAVAVTLTGGVARAASWTPTAAGTTYNWDNASSQDNWGTGVGGAFPNAIGDTANIASNVVGNQTINLNQAITLGTLNIGDTNNTNTFAIAANGGSLTFDNTGVGDAQLNVASTSKGDAISAGVAVTSNLVLTQNSANAFTISGLVSGAGSLTKSGSGAMVLTGANSYGGGTTLNAGTLHVNNASALGTGKLTINGGTITNSSKSGYAAITLSTNNAQDWNGDFTYAGRSTATPNDASWSLNLGTGAVALGGNRIVTVTGYSSSNNYSNEGASLTVGGAISDGGNNYSLTKAGNGTLVLMQANTIGGGVTLNAGRLKLGNGGAIGSQTLTINGGSLDVVGVLSFTNNNPMVWNGSFSVLSAISTGLSTGTGGVTLGNNVTITGGGNGYGSAFNVQGVISDGGNNYGLTIAGAANPAAIVLSAANTFTGGVTLNSGAFRWGNSNALGTGVFTINGGGIAPQGAVLGGVERIVWAGDFGCTNGTGEVNFGTAPVTLQGARKININNVPVTFGGPVSGTGAGITYTGTQYSSTLTLNGTNTFDGGTLVVAGSASATLAAGNASALGSGQVRLSSRSTSRLSLSADLTIDSLSSAIAAPTFTGGAGGPNGTQSLVITGGGGSGAAGTVTIASGAITAVTITDYGRDYTSTPTFALSNPGGTGTITGSFAASSVLLNARRLTIAGTNALPATYSGVISGTGGLTKDGSGVQILAGANTYTGTTIVNNGSLIVNGSLASGSAVTVAGGTLGGSGTIGGSVSITAGTLAPGNSPGILNTGALTLASGANYSVELNGAAVGTEYDQANVTGAVDLGGANLLASLGYAPTAGDSLFILANDGTDPITGTFAGLPQDSTVDLVYNSQTYRFQLSYLGDSASSALTGGNDVVLMNVAIPEPSTIMAAMGVIGLSLMRRQRTRA